MNRKEELGNLGYKSYENDEIIVYWNPNVCEHAGLCVQGDNEVFDSKRRPWIDLSKASSIKIAKIIDNCPSKALQYDLKLKIEFHMDESRSVALLGSKVIGECEIIESNSKWAITHTGVREEYNGRGIAKMLVLSIVDAARENNMKLLPLCSYAQKVLIDKEEYKDVL